MGIFSRRKKDDKIYSLGEAIKLLQTKKYEYYTTIPVGNGYRLIPMGQQMIQMQPKQEFSDLEEANSFKVNRNDFLYRMTENIDEKELSNVQKNNKYNNYQISKGYKQSQGVVR